MKKPFFVLAPMDDVTGTVFRRIVHDCAPADLYMTEFVNVDGLCSPGRPKLMPKLSTKNDKGPVIAQLWGKKPENFEQIAREISLGLFGDPEYESWLARELSSAKAQENNENRKRRTKGTAIETRKQLTQRFVETIRGSGSEVRSRQTNGAEFSGIDLNFGCPDKAVVKNECCSALAQEGLRDKAVEIIKATQKGARSASRRMPVSIKTRLGFGEIDYSWHRLLLENKPAMLTVHVRTTKQMSKVPANWDAIDEVVQLRDELSPKTKIVLNGDIANRQQGEELAKLRKVDGIMIGRGVFHNPYCFAEQSPWDEMDKDQRIYLLKKHLELFLKTWPNGERKYNPLKKFVKIYINKFEGASALRDRIMRTNSPKEALELLNKE